MTDDGVGPAPAATAAPVTPPVHWPPVHWPQVGVGVIVRKGDALLVIQRDKPPGAGRWSIPGGRQEAGETLFDTAIREVREETGVEITPRHILTAVDSIGRDAAGGLAFHYTVVEVVADWRAGDPVAGSDARAARWADRPTWEGLIDWPPLRDVLDRALGPAPSAADPP